MLSARSASKISPSITKPDGDVSGKTLRPASVISPSFSSLRQRSLFSSDHNEFFFRGVNLCAVTPFSSRFSVLSIQPKHRASSTASTYRKVSSFCGLPRFTTTRHSFSVLWFSINHARNWLRFFAFNKFSGSINTF